MSRTVESSELDQPIVRESVAEVVARRILNMVKGGVLKAGDILPPERELAQSLNVSRPSIREAVRGLTILGVVRTRQGGGIYISELDANKLLEPIHFYLALQEANVEALYDARSLIESDVARRAAEHIDDEMLAQLENIWEKQQETITDPAAFRMSDFAFHEAIWISAKNPFLKRIGESLNVLGLDFRMKASETPGILEQSLRDHRRMLDALQAHNPNAAAIAAAEHMRSVYRSTVAGVAIKREII